MLDFLNTGLILVATFGIWWLLGNIFIYALYLPAISKRTVQVFGWILLVLLTAWLLVILCHFFTIIAPKIVAFIFVMVSAIALSEMVFSLENKLYTLRLYLLDRFKEYYTYSQAAQLVTIFPYMNVGAKSKGEIDSITLKPLHNGTILGVGALSIKPSQNSSATVELYLTYAGPQQNYNMFPHVGGTPFLKKSVISDRQRLFDKIHCTEDENYLKRLHFKDMHKNFINTNALPSDQSSVPSYARKTTLELLGNSDRKLMWHLLSKNSEMHERVNHLERVITTGRQNFTLLQVENAELRASEIKSAEKIKVLSVRREQMEEIGSRIQQTKDYNATLLSEKEELKVAAIKSASDIKTLTMQNPYWGVNNIKGWKHMSELRVTLDKPESLLTDVEKAADTESRLLFLTYVVRDSIKIYFNVTSHLPVGAKLPASITPNLAEWTKSILVNIDKLFHAWLDGGGGP